MKTFQKLNKNEMKMIVGGIGKTGPGGGATCTCNTSTDCTGGKSCTNCGSGGSNGQKWGYCE